MTDEQTRQNILRLLRSTNREGIEGVIDYLCKSDFFRVRCHSHHHVAGGLAQHSLEACQFALSHSSGLSRDSVILGALLHDVCTSHHHDAMSIHGHGRRSVGILRDICGLRLTDEEAAAIKYHMHFRVPGVRPNRLVHLVWLADKASAAGRVHLKADRPGQIRHADNNDPSIHASTKTPRR